MGTDAGSNLSRSTNDPARRRPTQVWAVVLAGGHEVRLRSLIRGIFPEEAPKQYAPLMGPVSLFRQTIDRVAPLAPAVRTVVVSQEDQRLYIARDLERGSRPHVLFQPQDRGNGAAVLFAAHWIQQHDPDAIVAVFPSDHFVAEERAFIGHMAELVAFVAQNPNRLVLAGMRATEPDSDRHWIEPGAPLGHTSSGPIFQVRKVWERPDTERTSGGLTAGWLWNTMTFVVRSATLLNAGRDFLPTFLDRLSRAADLEGTGNEECAIRQAYALAPTTDLSRSLLHDCPPFLAVSKLPPVIWSDLATPARVLKLIGALGLRPPWMVDLERRVGALTTDRTPEASSV
jgi:mannose-1-phosphate guanylyltransferase